MCDWDFVSEAFFEDGMRLDRCWARGHIGNYAAHFGSLKITINIVLDVTYIHCYIFEVF